MKLATTPYPIVSMDPARNWRQVVAFAEIPDPDKPSENINVAFFSSQEQAALIFRIYLTNIAADIPLTVVYDWRDRGNDSTNFENTFGIVGFNYEKKSAYQMIKSSWATLLDRPFLSKAQPADCKGKKVHWMRFGERSNDTSD